MTEATGAPQRRGLLEYGRDGWRLGAAVYELALRRPELRRFAATTFGIVVIVEVLMAIGTLMIRHEGTIAQRIGWALGAGYVVAFLSNLAAVGLAGLSDGILAGRTVELRQGWRLMSRRIPHVAGWALLVIAIGIPARLMTGWVLDQLLAVLLGFGFAVLTFFAVPAIALRGDGAIGAAKRSLHLVGPICWSSPRTRCSASPCSVSPREPSCRPSSTAPYWSGFCAGRRRWSHGSFAAWMASAPPRFAGTSPA